MDYSLVSLLLTLLVVNYLSSCDATLFKFKHEKKQELLDHLKGKRALEHQHQKYGNGFYFGFPTTGFEHLLNPHHYFKHAIPVAYPVHKLVPIPHPVPVTVERPIPFPVPIHLKALGEYSSYEQALANFASITQQQQQYQQFDHNYNQQQQHQRYTHSYPQHQMRAPVYDQTEDCHPYCDINLPQGSSPVPLMISKVEGLAKKDEKKKTSDPEE